MSDAAEAAYEDTPRSTVDENPQAEGAKNKLARALSDRPDKKELVEKGILKDTKVAPALQAAQDALKRSQLEDSLDQKLQNRPKPEELVKGGILTGACLAVAAFLADVADITGEADEAPPST